MHNEKLAALATVLRTSILRMTTAAGSGHVTSSLSAVELMTALMFDGVFRADLRRPQYPTNDRLIFSKGHAAPLLYALYAALGVVTPKQVLTLRKFGSRLEGHPTMAFPYTETPTGSLGQGLSVALGEALASRMSKIPYRVFCLLGDSEMAEGSVWEAIELAGFLQVGNLVGIVDMNALGQSGPTMLGADAPTLARRVASFGWETIVVDGHNLEALHEAYRQATKLQRPTMIIAKTVKGQGVSFIAGQEGWHGRVLTKPELQRALKELGSVDVKLRGELVRPKLWHKKKLKTHSPKLISYTLNQIVAPRQAIGAALVRLGASLPKMIVLDGEVKNSTDTEAFQKKYPQRFLEGYIAEQNIIGMATGLAARGLLPVSATFAAFWTRAYDQLRMAAYSGYHQIVVGTHAGVHIGQDGVSQMGLQDISLFRSLERSIVLYPADAVAAESLFEKATKGSGIVYIRATRAALPVIYRTTQRFTIGGSFTHRSTTKDVATIVAAGVTLHEALRAAERLQKQGIFVRVIDLYSIKPIDVVTLKKAARQTEHIIVVEDHYAEGGIAEAVRSALGKDAGCVTSLAVRKTPRSGKPEELLSFEHLDASAIIAEVHRITRS